MSDQRVATVDAVDLKIVVKILDKLNEENHRLSCFEMLMMQARLERALAQAKHPDDETVWGVL